MLKKRSPKCSTENESAERRTQEKEGASQCKWWFHWISHIPFNVGLWSMYEDFEWIKWHSQCAAHGTTSIGRDLHAEYQMIHCSIYQIEGDPAMLMWVVCTHIWCMPRRALEGFSEIEMDGGELLCLLLLASSPSSLSLLEERYLAWVLACGWLILGALLASHDYDHVIYCCKIIELIMPPVERIVDIYFGIVRMIKLRGWGCRR